jgi:ketosteroid isomerase-like protein
MRTRDVEASGEPGGAAEAATTKHKRIASEFAQALVAADAATLLDIVSPNAIWHFPGRDHALAGSHEGIASIGLFAARVSELTHGTFHIELDDVYASEKGAVVGFTGHAQRPDGRTLSNPTRLVLRIADGHVQELWEFVWDGEAVAEFWR